MAKYPDATEEELRAAADAIQNALFGDRSTTNSHDKNSGPSAVNNTWRWVSDEEAKAAAEKHLEELGIPYNGQLGTVGWPGFEDGTTFFKASEVSKIVGMPTNTIYQFIREGRGPCHRDRHDRRGSPYSVSILSTQIAAWREIAKEYSQRKRIAPDRLYRGLIRFEEAQRVYAVSAPTLYKRIAEFNLTVYRDGRNLSVKWLKESDLEKAFGPRESARTKSEAL